MRPSGAAREALQDPRQERHRVGGHERPPRADDAGRWSKDIKPIAKTELCEAPHFLYQLSGRMKVVMRDGQEVESGPGDVVIIPPGHDAWVVGNEPVVVIDWGGAANYAKQ